MPRLSNTDGIQDRILDEAENFNPMESTMDYIVELFDNLVKICVELDEQIEERDKEIEGLKDDIKELEISQRY
jgi:hypothetical protein